MVLIATIADVLLKFVDIMFLNVNVVSNTFVRVVPQNVRFKMKIILYVITVINNYCYKQLKLI